MRTWIFTIFALLFVTQVWAANPASNAQPVRIVPQSTAINQVNNAGAGGVCVAVTTGAVVSIITGDISRKMWNTTCSSQVNVMYGTTAGGAPPVVPTTGAIGTGKGYPFMANTAYTETECPGCRLDVIAATANGFCCTMETF